MKIVFLDAKSVGEDIDLSNFNLLGEFVTFGHTTYEQIPERVADADIVITNKCLINEGSIGNASKLKLVCITATGTNNLDKEYLAKRQIEWRNVAGYSTESVAQHTFAMLFYLLEKLDYYNSYVKDGKYANDTSFTHFAERFYEIQGKTWGIVGLGNIGRRVADIAKAFGVNVIYYSTTGNNNQFFSFIVFDVKTVSIRSADKELVSYIIFKDLVCYFADTADRKVNRTVANTADRNRSLAIFRDRYLEELTRLCLSVKFHAECILKICMFDYFFDG